MIRLFFNIHAMSKTLKNLGNRLLATILQYNFRSGNYRDIFWVMGDGRSGTTWAADLINFRGNYRKMFEPFHPQLVEQVSDMALHQYIRPGDTGHQLYSITQNILSGRFTHPRVDSRNRALRYQGIVIKDIFTNLMAKWAVGWFPDVVPVMVVRNPFAVALSKARKSDWLWLHEPAQFLTQKELMADHLKPYTGLIEEIDRTGDALQKQILIWCIVHFVPFRQFSPGEIHLLFYENIYKDPQTEINNVLDQSLGPDRRPGGPIPPELIVRPTRSAGRDSHIERGISPIDSWKEELDLAQVDRGLKILNAFGLDTLYGEDALPTLSAEALLGTF